MSVPWTSPSQSLQISKHLMVLGHQQAQCWLESWRCFLPSFSRFQWFSMTLADWVTSFNVLDGISWNIAALPVLILYVYNHRVWNNSTNAIPPHMYFHVTNTYRGNACSVHTQTGTLPRCHPQFNKCNQDPVSISRSLEASRLVV